MAGDSKNNEKSRQEHQVISEDMRKDSEELSNGLEGDAEDDPKSRNQAEKTEEHTVTVREAAKIFEEANLRFTERTIINWCNPNKRGIVRLDAYFDESDGKYFITPRSIQQSIENESPRTKATQSIPSNSSENQEGVSEPRGKGQEKRPNISEEIPNDSENGSESDGSVLGNAMADRGNKDQVLRNLRQLLMDEKILNKGKDYFLEQLQKDRKNFVGERQELIQQMVLQGERIGKLESELRQLQAPRNHDKAYSRTPNRLENDADCWQPAKVGHFC
jgi:hypothetical protein